MGSGYSRVNPSFPKWRKQTGPEQTIVAGRQSWRTFDRVELPEWQRWAEMMGRVERQLEQGPARPACLRLPGMLWCNAFSDIPRQTVVLYIVDILQQKNSNACMEHDSQCYPARQRRPQDKDDQTLQRQAPEYRVAQPGPTTAHRQLPGVDELSRHTANQLVPEGSTAGRGSGITWGGYGRVVLTIVFQCEVQVHRCQEIESCEPPTKGQGAAVPHFVGDNDGTDARVESAAQCSDPGCPGVTVQLYTPDQRSKHTSLQYHVDSGQSREQGPTCMCHRCGSTSTADNIEYGIDQQYQNNP